MGNDQSSNDERNFIREKLLSLGGSVAKWSYRSNQNPWSKSEEEEWTEYTPEETQKIEEAFSLNKETVELDSYKILLKKRIQVHKQENFRQRPVKRIYQSIYSNLRQERFSLLSCKPTASDWRKLLYPSLIIQYHGKTDILAHRWGLFCALTEGNVLPDLVDAALKGILEEGALLGQKEKAQILASILKSFKKSEQDRIGEVCLQLYTSETFLYNAINKALMEGDDSKASTLGPFCVLLFFFLWRIWSGFLQFPRWTKEVFRGAQLSSGEIEMYQEIVKKEEPYFAWNGFFSTSKSRTKAEKFGNTLFIISLDERAPGADISSLSVFPDEEEVLLNAGSVFVLDKIEEEENGKYFVYLTKQVIEQGFD